MRFLQRSLKFLNLKSRHFLELQFFKSKWCSFTTPYILQKTKFSTRSPIYKYSIVDKELSERLTSEIQLEISSVKEVPENIKTFMDNNLFEINDHEDSNEVELVRQFKNEKISVSFSISDINNLESEDEYYQENENESMQNNTLNTKDDLPQFNKDDSTYSFPVKCNITITKPKLGTLALDAVTQDGVFMIDNILYYKNDDLALTQTAEADWQRRGIYMGPSFQSLNEDIQVMFERYLEERGINTSLALFIPEYVSYKEQKEYLNWLQNVKRFINA
ncbi:hypothetical protein PNEG_03251 [Pneumocystis murina B123]|uniref:Mitochondrial glyco protein n=1 Tax=Pneumocystis murina (strain B123) TaxID=1069680 RepID=M7P3J7_PNEMU|nr:hypothetical protein PNEG_03251 [Pneumocystis murina B123]EMR08415.1 hypothetical protein PNEG_03251 [Pneumocystis murina B123]